MGQLVCYDSNKDAVIDEVDQGPTAAEMESISPRTAKKKKKDPNASRIDTEMEKILLSIQEKKQLMLDSFGQRGKRRVDLLEAAYGFVDSEQFLTDLDQTFLTASGGDDEPLILKEFETGIEKVMTEMLQGSESMTKEEHVQLKKSDIRAWFKMIDSDRSGSITKSEFQHLMLYLANLKKLQTAHFLSTELEKQPNWRYFTKDGQIIKQFILGGDCKVGQAFELTNGGMCQEGHLLCTVPCKPLKSEIYVTLQYYATQLEGVDPRTAGEGLCVYLADPKVEGCFEHFEGTGPCGFTGKKGGVVAVFLDLGGKIAGQDQDTVCVRGPKADDPILGAVAAQGLGGLQVEGGGLQTGGKFWKIQIRFDTQNNRCDVKINGNKLIDGVDINQDKLIGGISFPKKVVAGVCAATSVENVCKFCVNKLTIKMEPDDDWNIDE